MNIKNFITNIKFLYFFLSQREMRYKATDRNGDYSSPDNAEYHYKNYVECEAGCDACYTGYYDCIAPTGGRYFPVPLLWKTLRRRLTAFNIVEVEETFTVL